MTSDAYARTIFTASTGRLRDERMDARTRRTLRVVSRYLAALRTCYRTRDSIVLGDPEKFVAGRPLHTFGLDNRAIICQIDALGSDDVRMTVGTRELLSALRSYLAYLEGVLVIEPPLFGLPPRQMDVRCVAFRPEVEAFRGRIEALIAIG